MRSPVFAINRKDRIMGFKDWTEQHEGGWQFIKFNILSNISTVTRFVLVAIFTVVFAGLTQPFQWFIFSYGTSAGGLGGFLTFLLAEIPAQAVNYIVQMKLTFKSTVSHRVAGPRFLVLACINIIVSIELPSLLNTFLAGVGVTGMAANMLSTVLNLVAQVLICYYPMKYWVFSGGSGKGDKAEKVEEK